VKRLSTASILVFLFLISISLSVSVRAQENASLDAKLASAIDLRVPAGAISLQVQRRLETGRTQRGPLGIRWRLNWESRLSRGGGLIQIEDWTGVISFTQTGQPAQYSNASGGQMTLSPDGRAVRTMPDGGSETFDADGRLVERTYHHGNKARLRYTAQGRLARVEGPGGSFLQFTSDSTGRVIQVDSSTGMTVRYAYDKDDLTEVQINGGLSLRYGYDAKGALVRIEDPQTGSLEIAYDSKGRVVSYRRTDGSEQRFEYDDATNTKRTIEANGATTITRESPDKRRTEITDSLGNKSAIQLDEAGHPLIITGPTGASSRMGYDASGRLVAVEDALGHPTRYEYAGDSSTVKTIVHADGTRQEFAYDDHNNLTTIKIGGKIISALTYNPDGSIATAKEPGAKEQKFTYYASGLVKTVANALGETRQFEYDARGNLVRETNSLGGVSLRSYDSQDRLVSVTNPAGGTTRYEYDDRSRLMRETDPAGGVTRFEYDALGRLSSETNPAGHVTRFEYTPVDKVARVIRPGNQTENYSYDLAGNLVAQTDRLGRTTRFEYDPVGRIIREQRPGGLEVRYRYDAAGNLQSFEDSSGAKSEIQTDASGQTAMRINPAGGKTQYQYDAFGYLLAVTDPLGRFKQFGHTSDGDLTQVGEPSGDEAHYEYDSAGRVVAIRRPSGGATRLTYDRMGNLLTVTDPLGNVKRYSYDNAGRLLSMTDAANRVTRYVYDKAGQRVEKQQPDGKRVAYKYDALGRMIEADDGAFPVRMSYDDTGNLKQVEYAVINKAVAYAYDAQGLRTKMTAPDGHETRYEYDALKRLAAVIPPDGKRIAFTYDNKNRIESIVYPNGITGRWNYDAVGQISKISYQDKSGKAVAGSSYRYDPVGNPVERQDSGGQTSRFAYDPAGQLVEETSPDSTIKYRYAPGGNRAEVEEGARVSRYKHDAADRLIEAGQEQLSYDANGNLISRKGPGGATAYEYDTENRLVKVVAADGAVTTYGYAPTGERVWRRDKSGITYFLYDGLELIAELNNDLRTRTTFVHGFGIDRPLAMLQDKQSYYYHADRVGSIMHLTDSNGMVAAAYSYDAFGKIKTKQGTVANPFAYTGRELDPTGLYYYRARYYDPSLGRFLSNDLIAAPIDQPLEQNPYLYVRNNPVRFVDPFGLDSYTPESLASMSTEALQRLWVDTAKDPNGGNPWQIYGALRAREAPPRVNPFRFEGVRQPDGTTEWELRRPDGSAVPQSAPAAPRQQVVGRPGQAGPANPNPTQTDAIPAPRGNPTGAVNGGSANRASANTNAVRPQPGPPGSNTQQIGEERPGGNTLRAPAPGALGPGKGFWTLDPRTIDPTISRLGTVASIVATAVDCYRNGLSNCGPKIATGLVIGGIATSILGKAVGPIGTIIAGGRAWWQIGKELGKDQTDWQQRDQQEKARQAQEQENIKNRDAFDQRIEQLRAKINALKKDHDIATENPTKAGEQARKSDSAALQAQKSLEGLRDTKRKKDTLTKNICDAFDSGGPAKIKGDIDALATQAEAKQSEIDRLINEGKQITDNCASIRDKYNRIRPLLQQIDQLKKAADQKQADLERLRKIVADFKGQYPATVTTDVADKSLEADIAVKEATRLVTQVRDSILVLEAGRKQLRREIDGLHGALAEPLPADIQNKFNELQGLLSSITQYPPLVRYDDQAGDSAKVARNCKDEALRILEGWKVALPCSVDVPSADSAIQRINTALTMAALNDAGDLLRQARACDASAKCIPSINQARQLLEQLQIEDGEAAISQARQAGCDVTGLETALDYYRTIRDVSALLNKATELCKFQEGRSFALRIPSSIQSKPAVAAAISRVQAAAAAQEQVEQYITSATNAAVQASDLWRRAPTERSRIDKGFAQADSFVAQADGLAAPYPCLVDRVNKYKGEYNKLKVSANWKDPNQPPDDVPNALDPGKRKTQRPADDVPEALGAGGTRRPAESGGGNANSGGGTGSGSGGADGTVNPPLAPGVRPCDATERTAFSKITGSWKSGGPKISITGSCEKATGTFEWAEYCEDPDRKDNASLPRYRGKFTGRMMGGSLQIDWELPGGGVHEDQKGSSSCEVRSDGTLSCNLGCNLRAKKQ
jgi:RHS repeat-associated protein